MHLLMPSSHSHCFQHCNTVTICFRPLSQVDRPCRFFVSTKNSGPFLPSLSHTRTVFMKDKHIHGILYLQDRKPSHHPTPPRSSQLTVKFWFSRAVGSSHPSSLLTHVKNEKRDKQVFHLRSYADTETHTRKTPFNNLICRIFHGSRCTYSILCQLALFFSTAVQPATPHTVCVRAKSV